MNAIQELRSIPLLEKLDEDELEKLASIAIRRSVKKGTYLIQEDDSDQSLMFIASGKVSVTLVGNEGKEIVVTQLSEGEFFGEISLLTGVERSANVVTASSSVIFVVSKIDFERHIVSNSGLSYALLQFLAERLRKSTGKIGDLMLFDVHRRVARTLKKLAEFREINGERVYVIDKRPTHQELASMVGTSREMVTRVLKSLEEDECIFIDGKTIRVLAIPL